MGVLVVVARCGTLALWTVVDRSVRSLGYEEMNCGFVECLHGESEMMEVCCLSCNSFMLGPCHCTGMLSCSTSKNLF